MTARGGSRSPIPSTKSKLTRRFAVTVLSTLTALTAAIPDSSHAQPDGSTTTTTLRNFFRCEIVFDVNTDTPIGALEFDVGYPSMSGNGIAWLGPPEEGGLQPADCNARVGLFSAFGLDRERREMIASIVSLDGFTPVDGVAACRALTRSIPDDRAISIDTRVVDDIRVEPVVPRPSVFVRDIDCSRITTTTTSTTSTTTLSTTTTTLEPGDPVVCRIAFDAVEGDRFGAAEIEVDFERAPGDGFLTRPGGTVPDRQRADCEVEAPGETFGAFGVNNDDRILEIALANVSGIEPAARLAVCNYLTRNQAPVRRQFNVEVTEAADVSLQPIDPPPTVVATVLDCDTRLPVPSSSTSTSTSSTSSTSTSSSTNFPGFDTTTTLPSPTTTVPGGIPGICKIFFRLGGSEPISALQVEVDYSNAPPAGFVELEPLEPGGNPQADCDFPLTASIFASSIDPARRAMQFAIINAGGFEGPRSLGTCDYLATERRPEPEDFSLRILELSGPDITELGDEPRISIEVLGCGGATTTTTTTTLPTVEPQPRCGFPVTGTLGRPAPMATDALFALYAAVGVSDCDVCVCDADGSGTVFATDARGILFRAIGMPFELRCPPCE